MDVEIPSKDAKSILLENKSGYLKRVESEVNSQMGKMSDRTMLY